MILACCEDNLEGELYLHGIDRFGWTRAIICRDKNVIVLEYALRIAGRPIGVATYAVVAELPEAYRDQLPGPEEIAERPRVWERAGTGDGE